MRFKQLGSLGCILALLLSQAACEEASSSAPPPRAEALAAVPVTSLGCADCSGLLQLSEILQVWRGHRGSVYVVNAVPPFVRIVDTADEAPDGADPAEVTGIVEKGQGPGEAQAVRFVYENAAGDALAYAWARQRLLRFGDVEHRLVQEWDMSRAIGRISGTDYVAESDKLYVLDTAALVTRTGAFRVSEIDGETGEHRILFELPRDRLADEGQERRGPYVSFAASKNGLFAFGFGSDEQYKVRLFSVAGEPAGSISRDVEKVAKSPERLAAEQRRAENANRPAPPATEAYDHYYGDALHFDDTGRLWILTGRGLGRGASVFDVFSEGGQYLGSLEVPELVKSGCRCFVVGDDTLVAAVDSPDGHERVGIWNIHGLASE